eukprot:2023419-Pyramimonas_sp.AAC.1
MRCSWRRKGRPVGTASGPCSPKPTGRAHAASPSFDGEVPIGISEAQASASRRADGGAQRARWPGRAG